MDILDHVAWRAVKNWLRQGLVAVFGLGLLACGVNANGGESESPGLSQAGTDTLSESAPPTLPTPAPLTTTFSFGSDVSAADRLMIERSIAYAKGLAESLFGYATDDFTVFAHKDVQSMIDANAGWYGIRSPTSLEALRARWSGGNVGMGDHKVMFLFLGSPNWGKGGDDDRTVIHEYFHVLQHALLGDALSAQSRSTPSTSPRASGPTWLVEGSADLFRYLAHAQRTGVTLETLIQEEAVTSARHPSTLTGLEIPQKVYDDDPGYRVSRLGTYFLTKNSGLPSLVSFFRLLGEGIEWRDAFQRAFNQSIADFYSDFETYRVTLIVASPSLPATQGNAPAPQYGLKFVGPVPPGSFQGSSSSWSGVRLEGSGLAGVNLLGQISISPTLSNTPGGIVGTFVRNQSRGLIDIPIPPAAASGRYTVTIRTPDGGTVSATFDYPP